MILLWQFNPKVASELSFYFYCNIENNIEIKISRFTTCNTWKKPVGFINATNKMERKKSETDP